jgi:hypothetical protein
MKLYPLVVTLALYLAFQLPASASSAIPEELVVELDKMQTFYQSPGEEKFRNLEAMLDKHEQVLGNDDGSDILLAVMLARISTANGWSIRAQGRIAQMAEEVLDGKSELAVYIADDSIVDPIKLDIWWASFFSTGDRAYLEKIYQQTTENGKQSDIVGFLVTSAARWSFGANCRQNNDVRAFAADMLEKEVDPDQRAFLKKCVAEEDATKEPE